MRLYSVALVGLLLFAPRQPMMNSFVHIDKSDNSLTYYSYGVAQRTFQVATARVTQDTPSGLFPVVMRVKNPWYLKKNIPGGTPENPLGVRWIGLEVPGTDGSIYGIHGTNQPELIGRHVSAGCIRMRNEDVSWLYDHVRNGTLVEIVE